MPLLLLLGTGATVELPLYVGDDQVDALYVGDTEVDGLAVGDDEIYP